MPPLFFCVLPDRKTLQVRPRIYTNQPLARSSVFYRIGLLAGPSWPMLASSRVSVRPGIAGRSITVSDRLPPVRQPGRRSGQVRSVDAFVTARTVGTRHGRCSESDGSASICDLRICRIRVPSRKRPDPAIGRFSCFTVRVRIRFIRARRPGSARPTVSSLRRPAGPRLHRVMRETKIQGRDL